MFFKSKFYILYYICNTIEAITLENFVSAAGSYVLSWNFITKSRLQLNTKPLLTKTVLKNIREF